VAFTLAELEEVLRARRQELPGNSYTARLLARGRAKIAQKLGEEAVETVIEAVAGDKDKLAQESADLLYHLLVLWADCGVAPADVWADLARRQGKSGIEEKKERKS